jgi:2-dehydropantoate 2-reductase
MLADVLAGRRTEVEEINGAVAALGRELNVAAPVNEALAALVRAIEATASRRE